MSAKAAATAKPVKGKKGKKGKGKKEAAHRPQPNLRLRWVAYNGAAAALGHGVVWSVTGDPWAGADLLGRASVSLVPIGVTGVVAAAAYGGWKAGGLLSGLPGVAGRAVRPALALGGALWGQGSAPLLTAGIDALDGLPIFLAPLLIAAGAGAACWWALEKRCAGWWVGLRFTARVPLATVVLSSALYAPGVLL
ncbi:hypothetical protein ACIP93_37550 [Streptomyces sp. NPDC088745]|uniref:hypothetical protein n=1 Tax=Streptomyces sp. NPDC088745 TaxID=3365884 RepID=UPI00382B56E8